MPRFTARSALIAALAVVALGGTAAIATAAVTGQFGYHKVRDGLPKGLPKFSVSSTDLAPGKPIPERFWSCTSAGPSPELSWAGAPASTQSYVVTMFDSDAPTGSGFWHWVAWDIPAGVNSLPTGAVLPADAVNGENDGGTLGYQGPCPPVGDRTHHYHITVVALDVPSLGLPATTHAAVVGFNVGAHALAAAEFVATAQR
jgi:Raf kinase inhibitor-like YbhB/YbcL family protein